MASLSVKYDPTSQKAPSGRGSDTHGKDAARARPSRAARVMLRTPPRAALGPSLLPSPSPDASGQGSAGPVMLKRTRLERPAPAAQPPPLPPLSALSRACAAPLALRASLYSVGGKAMRQLIRIVDRLRVHSPFGLLNVRAVFGLGQQSKPCGEASGIIRLGRVGPRPHG